MMRRIKFVIATLALAIAVMGANAQTLNDVNKKFDEAMEAYGAKNLPAAIEKLTEVMRMGAKVGPDAKETLDNAKTYLVKLSYQYSGGLMKSGKMEEAIAQFEKTAELGELYGDIATMRKANEWIAKIYTNMAAEAFNGKDYAKAAEIFAKGYASNPKDTDLALNLAMSYCEMGDIEKGFAIYRDIVALESTHSKYKAPAAIAKDKIEYYSTVGAADAIKKGDVAKGISMLEDILKADPQNATANLMLIQTATNRKDWKRVIARGEVAAEAQTDPALKSTAYFLLGAAYQNTEDVDKAIATYQKVTEGSNVAAAKEQIKILTENKK